ncbi:RT0821/Lpp0805 family surface protein [Thiolapillus sp.]
MEFFGILHKKTAFHPPDKSRFLARKNPSHLPEKKRCRIDYSFSKPDLLKMNNGSRILLFAMLALASLGIQASNWQWLHNSSLKDLSDADWQIMSKTLKDMLDTATDGESRHWNNPQSGHEGEITILNSPQDAESTCRQVRFSPDKNSGSNEKPLIFCKDETGEWLIRSPSQPK